MIKELLEKYLSFLWNAFMYDMEVFSQPWIYYCLLVPACCYFAFFVIKWIVLTLPIWLPLNLILSALRNSFKN